MLLLVMLPLQPAAAQTAPAAPPAWTFKESTDAATGKKSATAQIRAADGTGRLIVRCDTIAIPIVSVQYIPRPPLPASDRKSIVVTIDEASAEIAAWEFPGAGAYLGEPYDVFSLAEKIAAAKTIRLNTSNAAGEPIQSVFKGPGNDTLFRQVYATCGIPYELPAVGLTNP
ncbi:MAG: hypothetical protein V4574_03950 [Pseudomonadota bacterium]